MDNAMKLILKGQGYFLDLDSEVVPARAQIMLFPETLCSKEKKASLDQVILDCSLSTDLARELRAFDDHNPIAQGVVVQFEAGYSQYLACYAGQHHEDPPNMLMLQADLMKITNWRQDSTALQWIKS